MESTIHTLRLKQLKRERTRGERPLVETNSQRPKKGCSFVLVLRYLGANTEAGESDQTWSIVKQLLGPKIWATLKNHVAKPCPDAELPALMKEHLPWALSLAQGSDVSQPNCVVVRKYLRALVNADREDANWKLYIRSSILGCLSDTTFRERKQALRLDGDRANATHSDSLANRDSDDGYASSACKRKQSKRRPRPGELSLLPDKERTELLDSARAWLTPTLYQVFELYSNVGLRTPEIAKRLGRAPGTVRACMFRARRILLQRLKPQAMVEEDEEPEVLDDRQDMKETETIETEES